MFPIWVFALNKQNLVKKDAVIKIWDVILSFCFKKILHIIIVSQLFAKQIKL